MRLLHWTNKWQHFYKRWQINCCNIWCIAYHVSLEHNNYWFTHFTYVLLLHYLEENFLSVRQHTMHNRWLRYSEFHSSGLTAFKQPWPSSNLLGIWGAQIGDAWPASCDNVLIRSSAVAERPYNARLNVSHASYRRGRPDTVLDWRSLQSIVDSAADKWHKSAFIATQLNSTELNSMSSSVGEVSIATPTQLNSGLKAQRRNSTPLDIQLSCVAINGP